jgi:hypothetical protein
MFNYIFNNYYFLQNNQLLIFDIIYLFITIVIHQSF